MYIYIRREPVADYIRAHSTAVKRVLGFTASVNQGTVKEFLELYTGHTSPGLTFLVFMRRRLSVPK